MAERITKKKYYKITFDLASPLALGSGDNDKTDKDLIKDAAGRPYIPASSVAGVVREYLIAKDREKAIKYLGDVVIAKSDTSSKRIDGSIVFYDAVIDSPQPTISVRDSVALDEFKTAISGAKFDMEVLEPGVSFTTFIEQDFTEDRNEDYGMEIADVFLNGHPVFGGKGTRGYGRLNNIQICEKSFDLSEKNDIEKWLNFDIFKESEWDKSNVADESGEIKEIKLSLRLRGGISIRRYTTRVSSENEKEPDMEQLTLADNTPVIPGSSWAGAIAHRMREFGIKTDKKGNIFGYVEGECKDAKAKSKIVFNESQIKGGTFKTLSRNAIDRFTGGTVDGALFTERTYYGGTTDLVIGWRGKEPMPENECGALAAALTDLHYGFLSVGGETSIGRGIFTIERINGQDIPADNADNSKMIYETVLSKIKEVFK